MKEKTILKPSKDMLSFYTETIDNILKHMKETIIFENKDSFNDSITTFNIQDKYYNDKSPDTTIITFPIATYDYKKNSMESNKEILKKYFNSPKCNLKRKSLLNELRFMILTALDIIKNKEERKLLLFYQSVLHLISLMYDKDTAYCFKLSEWLNINYKECSLVNDALRGNFNKITERYKFMDEIIEEFINIEQICKKKKEENNEPFFDVIDKSLIIESENIKKEEKIGLISKLKNFLNREKIELTGYELYDNLYLEWRTRNKENIPEEIRDIFLGKYKPTENINYIENLCYELLYKKRCDGCFIDSKEELKKYIHVDDVYTRILIEDFKGALGKCDTYLNLIIFFTSPLEDKSDRYLCEDIQDIGNIFSNVGKRILSLDWRLAFQYFSFSEKSEEYFEILMKNPKMDSSNQKKDLLFFAKSNHLQIGNVVEHIANSYMKDGNYIPLLELLKENNVDLEYSDDFVRFCVSNYSVVKKDEGTDSYFLKNSQYKFINNMGQLNEMKNCAKEELNIDFLDCIFSSDKSFLFAEDIVAKILDLDVRDEKIYLNLLDFIIKLNDKHNYLRDVMNPYKKKILEKLDDLYSHNNNDK